MPTETPETRIDSFVSVLEASGDTKWRSDLATEEQLSELAELAGHELPAMWLKFLRRVGVPEDVAWEPPGWEWRTEAHNVTWGVCPLHLPGIDSIVRDQRELPVSVSADTLGLGVPLFYASAIDDSGSFIVLAGNDQDPAVLIAPHPGQNLSSFHLIALSFSRWVEGLWLPPEFGNGWLPTGESPTGVRTTDIVFQGSDGRDQMGWSRVMSWFDELLDSMMGVIVPPRNTPNVVGRGWIMNRQYYRLEDKYRRKRPEAFSIWPGSLRSRMLTVVEMCIGVAALLEHGSGHVEDHIGCFGKGPGAELSISEAVDALADMRVDGDLDELMLDYRYRVAVPVAAHHNYWPMDS